MTEHEDRIAALIAAGDKLASNARHPKGCAISNWMPRGDWGTPCPECTGGLTDAQKAWQEARGHD